MQVQPNQKVRIPRRAASGRIRFAIGTAIAVAMLLVALPALADDYGGHGYEYDPPFNCTSGRLCVYAVPGWNGGYAQFSGSNTDWSCCSSEEDNDESAYNNGTSGMTVTVYTLPNYDGNKQYCLRMGHGLSYLAGLGSHHANNGDSNRWLWGDC